MYWGGVYRQVSTGTTHPPKVLKPERTSMGSTKVTFSYFIVGQERKFDEPFLGSMGENKIYHLPGNTFVGVGGEGIFIDESR